jgi:dTDP-4-dehydrorhamnose reductase
MKKILITGSNGLLGSNLVRYFSVKSRYQVSATSRNPSFSGETANFTRGDLRDTAFVESLLEKAKPDTIINTVGLVNLENCEQEPDTARSVIVQTAANLARAARAHGARLIHISTDHLFDGTRSMYTEEDTPAPVNIYGRMKLEAEKRVAAAHEDTAIIRTNFYGWSPARHPQTSGEWIFHSLKQQSAITLFTDYYFTPIEVTDLAEALEEVAQSDFKGIINIAGAERCSKYDFGTALAEVFHFDSAPIQRGTIAGVVFKARRQPDLSLSTAKFRRLFKRELPDLRDGLRRFYENRATSTS